MQQYALAPFLTERDPVDSAEGGINPLGTEALADALAVRLAPGVRERQRHPRFLTAMAVSLEVCSVFDEEMLAADGVSAPWQVFEWYLVEGLVRSAENEERVGLPGSLKAARAIADGVPLSAKRYLKTLAVFGFHGVYRQLARALGIEDQVTSGFIEDEIIRRGAGKLGCKPAEAPSQMERIGNDFSIPTPPSARRVTPNWQTSSAAMRG